MNNESNRSYRIRTNVNSDTVVNVNINQDIDMLEILSLKISTEDIYKLHTSSYGVVVGRVLVNGGVGVPNAKISVFIEANEETLADDVLSSLYPYTRTSTKNSVNIRYNLLPDEQVKQCHQQIGTMPNKSLVLDDDNTLEIFDQYYKFTTRSNNAGDYMIFGVPVGNQTIHVDIDLSDVGLLSQKPIDMMYKGYNATQFENASQFKKDTNLDSLPQVVSQNSNVYVYPFWGDKDESEIKITRNDIDVDYKFEPTCIFIGSMVTDDKSNGISKECIPPVNMGRMDRLTTGSGTIEMIRKKADGSVEEYPIMGNQLIDGNGTWCYQIPMNLDYVTTDEYGNMVPTDDPTKGIATRARVRFRVSLSDFESDYTNIHLSKLLVPNNPHSKEDLDYAFGSATLDKEDGTGSFRDLFWNNVYTVKSYIPRIQKGNNQRTNRFTGFKNVNVHNSNNPIPYNNMRVNITFMFTLQCAIIKCLLFFIKVYNFLMYAIPNILNTWKKTSPSRRCAYIGDGLCPDLEGWYFAPGCRMNRQLERSLEHIKSEEGWDEESTEYKNKENELLCISTNISYFMQCLEINLAMENEVIQFDFYNDWINGLLYIPRWMVNIKKKKSYLFGLIRRRGGVRSCSEEYFNNVRRFTQQCALSYEKDKNGNYSRVSTPKGCTNNKYQKCHKTKGRKSIRIFGKANGGLIHREDTLQAQSVYYPKPCEWHDKIKCNFFATDIVLLGNINSCNEQGVTNDLSGLISSTYQLPPNLVQTNMDSDGALYGIGGRHICSGGGATYNNGVEPIEQSFNDYINWSKGQEFYEKNPDETEYAVTELSGIDWGLNGPNQDKGSLKELFMPGGHFLGIACSNAQVNIKSCVNLSRICELGVMMSQRQYKIVKKENEDAFKYVYLIPSGLVSKDEISDNNYRNVFATLNHNGLKTSLNKENLLRKYDFISIKPINFNGELSKYTSEVQSSPYNKYKGDESIGSNAESTDAYVRTYEDNSSDYYRFRLGITGASINLKEKYLINNGSSVAMPMFENSFYFYFGLKDGSTAIDRFLQNYYAPCPNNMLDAVPSVKVTSNDYEICNEKGYGTVTFETKNIKIPYSWEILKENGNAVVFEKTEEKYEVTIDNNNRLTEGTYVLHVSNGLYGVDITKNFTINRVLPQGEDWNKISIEKEEFYSRPTITINKDGGVAFSEQTGFDGADSNNGGLIKFNIENEKNKIFYKGLIVVGGGYYCLIDFYGDGDRYDEILNKLDLKGLLKLKTGDLWNEDKKELKVWSENDTYDIYGIFTCNMPYYVECNYEEFKKIIKGREENFNLIFKGDENGKRTYFSLQKNYEKFITLFSNAEHEIEAEQDSDVILVNTIEIDVIAESFDFYIYDNSITLQELINKGAVQVGTYQNKDVGKSKYCCEINVEALEKLSPEEEWKVKKALIYGNSLSENEEAAIRVGLNDESSDAAIETMGYGEMEFIDEDSDDNKEMVYVSKDSYVDGATGYTDYVLDINNFKVPTQPWKKGSINEEINTYTQQSYQFIKLNGNDKKSYYLRGYGDNDLMVWEKINKGGDVGVATLNVNIFIGGYDNSDGAVRISCGGALIEGKDVLIDAQNSGEASFTFLSIDDLKYILVDGIYDYNSASITVIKSISSFEKAGPKSEQIQFNRKNGVDNLKDVKEMSVKINLDIKEK